MLELSILRRLHKILLFDADAIMLVLTYMFLIGIILNLNSLLSMLRSDFFVF